MINHASIVPLIGGETIAQEMTFGAPPSAIYSFQPFRGNDLHLRHYYAKKNIHVPYFLLDALTIDDSMKHHDVINTVCPCAGLSSLSMTSKHDNPMNDWMLHTAEIVLSKLKPKVFWGENAPRLGTKSGEPVVKKFFKMAIENGYTMTIYRTKSLLHGLPQVRERTFYFFWKGNKTPILNYFNRKHRPVEEYLLDIPEDATQQFSLDDKKASDDPYYKFVLSDDGMSVGTHSKFVNIIDKSISPMDFLERNNVTYQEVSCWMKKHGYEKVSKRCRAIHDKLMSGKNIMRRCVVVPKNYTGAFVGHLSTQMAHPKEDRFITVREALKMMAMPDDFELLEPKKNINHICQNVPVTTAKDMSDEIKAVLEGNREFVYVSLVYQYNHKQQHTIKQDF